MKRLLLPLVLCIGALALAAGLPANVTANTLQQGSGSAPTLSTQGIDINGAQGWGVVLSADAGDTLVGSGQALCYWYAPNWVASGDAGYVWSRCATGFDVTPVAGQRLTPSPQFETPVGVGRLYYAPVALYATRPDAGTRDAGVDVTIIVRRRP